MPIDTAMNERRRAGVRRSKKQNPKTDMTPMVDLGFLLITFFVITTELNRPATLALGMPKDGPPIRLGNANALTFLLEKDNTIHYYHGEWDEASKNNQIFQTNFSAKTVLRKLIREKQQRLDSVNKKEGRSGLMILIKPGKEATYRNVIDMLDEALISDVKKYAVLKQTDMEVQYLALLNN